MKLFITGASGHVGSLVTAELIKNGHQVVGLARSEESAQKLQAAGAEVIRGSLDELDVVTEAAKESDGVIHLAFRHDLAFGGAPDGMQQAAAIDRTVLEALGDVLEGTNKPLVGVGGTLLFAQARLGRPGLETDVLTGGGRIENENLVIGFKDRGIRSSVVRLSPTTHGEHDNNSGFIPTLITIARKNGFAGYSGDGQNHWTAVHELDAAKLFRLAAEKAPAGSRLHGVADEALTLKEISETIAGKLGIEIKSMTAEETQASFGPWSFAVTADAPASNKITKELLGWEPTHPGLIEDLKADHYFNEQQRN